MKVLRANFELLLENPLSVLRFLLALIMGSGTVNKLKTVSSVDFYSDHSLSKTWVVSLFPDGILGFVQEMYFPFLVVIILCSVGAALGFLGRVNLFALALMSFLLGGLTEGLGNFDHNYSLPSQVLLVLAVIPGSMGLSLDALLFKKTLRKQKTRNNGRYLNSGRQFRGSGRSGWGFNLVLALLVATYLTAGVSKIRYGGLEWIDGSTLTFYLQNHVSQYPTGTKQLLIANDSEGQKVWKDKYGFQAHTYGNYQTSSFNKKIADWVATKPSLVSFFALTTILIEICGFVVFFNSKWRNAYLITAILMHTSIGVLMGIFFTKYRIICFCLMDWKIIYQGFRKKYRSLVPIPT